MPATFRCPMLPSFMNCPAYLICPETLLDGLHSLVRIGALPANGILRTNQCGKGSPWGNGGSRGLSLTRLVAVVLVANQFVQKKARK
jgi:hypothetical protein